MVYYNENDPYASNWLELLIEDGLLPKGHVDKRSILDVCPSDLSGYAQCHFFTGIGGWPLAVGMANWPDDKQVWTGSCPCQPFSISGQGKGGSDERHLWPFWFHLIQQCRPSVLFGEQVIGALRFGWADLVQSDMEGTGYRVGFAGLAAASVGAYHNRERLFFVADTRGQDVQRLIQQREGVCQPEKKTPTKRSNYGLYERFRDVSDPTTIMSTYGVSRPVGIVRGFGNAIVPQVAKRFIRAYMDCII